MTSKDSSAYLTVSGFLGGEQGVHRASIITVERLDNMTSQVTGDTATVDFDYTEGGYDINPSTGLALETPTVLAPVHVTATLKLVSGLWLVDSYVDGVMKRLAAFLAAVLLDLAAVFDRRVALGRARSPSASTDWTAPDGHAFVGVQANGQWATPSSSGYCSVWQLKAVVAPNEWVYWVWVHQNGCSGPVINSTNPLQVITTPGKPGIGIHANTSAGMSLYLDVSVQPDAAPAMSQRTVSAQLTAGWLPALNGAIQAYVVPDSVHVTSWTVSFGDGSTKTFPPDPSNPFGLTTTHTYGSGQFNVVAIAHVSGQAYGAFFAPDGTAIRAARSLLDQHQQSGEWDRGADPVRPAGRERRREPVRNAS